MSGGQRRRLIAAWGQSSGVVAVEPVHGKSFLAVNLEMFPQRGGVGVGLVAASDPTVVGLISGVNMHVFLPVARVGEPSVTARNLALEWFLAWNKRNVSYVVENNQTISNELLMNQCRAMY